MSDRRVLWLLAAVLPLAALAPGPCAPTPIVYHEAEIGDFSLRYWKTGSRRVGRTATEFTFAGELSHDRPELVIEAFVSIGSSNAAMVPSDAQLRFFYTPSQATTSTSDTFSLTIDRRSPFVPGDLDFSIEVVLDGDPPETHPLARDDADAVEVIQAVVAANPTARIRFHAKRDETNPVTGESYEHVKLEADGLPQVASMNTATRVIDLTGRLSATEEHAALDHLAQFSSPGYAKMTRQLLARMRLSQGGVLGGPPNFDLIESLLTTSSSAELDALEAAAGPFVVKRLEPTITAVDEDGQPVTAQAQPFFGLVVDAFPAVIVQLCERAEVLEADLYAEPTPALNVARIATRAGELEQRGYAGLRTHVAVLDSGISKQHPDVRPTIRVYAGPVDLLSREPKNFCEVDLQVAPPPAVECDCPGATTCCADGRLCVDGYSDVLGHGTAVAGAVAGRDANRRGVAPDAALVGIRVGDTSMRQSRLLVGLDYVSEASFIDVANLSLQKARSCKANKHLRCVELTGSCGSDDQCNMLESDGFSPVSKKIDALAYESNVSMVIAMGNDGQGDGGLAIPSIYSDAANGISVGAADRQAQVVSHFSTRGPTSDGRSKPDVVAPGGELELPGHVGAAAAPYVTEDGTSFAAPQVAGLIASLASFADDTLLEPNGDLPADTQVLKAVVINTADPLVAPRTDQPPEIPLDSSQGAGRIDAIDAFEAFADDARVWQQYLSEGERFHWYTVDIDPALGSELVLTLVWERQVDADNPGEEVPLNDLDLAVERQVAGMQPQTTARSNSLVDNVEHLRVATPDAERLCVGVKGTSLERNGAQSYALASSPFRLAFHGTRAPCLSDFGDAPLPTAEHRDWTKEWLGFGVVVDGELEKASGASHTRPVSLRDALLPSVSGEAVDDVAAQDQDGAPNLVDQDLFDDGVSVPSTFVTGVETSIVATVSTSIPITGFGPPREERHADSRYDAAAGGTKSLYLTAWADWDLQGDLGTADETLIPEVGAELTNAAGQPLPAGAATVVEAGGLRAIRLDPEFFGPDGLHTLGEDFEDINGSGRWEAGEATFDAAGATTLSVRFDTQAPGHASPGASWARFRLAYGAPAGPGGVASHGEAEDYPIEIADHCESGLQDVDEEDIDCGGADCADCLPSVGFGDWKLGLVDDLGPIVRWDIRLHPDGVVSRVLSDGVQRWGRWSSQGPTGAGTSIFIRSCRASEPDPWWELEVVEDSPSPGRKTIRGKKYYWEGISNPVLRFEEVTNWFGNTFAIPAGQEACYQTACFDSCDVAPTCQCPHTGQSQNP